MTAHIPYEIIWDMSSCVDCSKKLDRKITTRCYECNKKHLVGKNSPFWQGGNSSCIDCGKITTKKTAKRCRICHDKYTIGEKSYAWKGGLTPLSQAIRTHTKNIKWRTTIFKRDNYICQKCNQKGGNLEAHHIHRFSDILKENNIKTINEALNCKALWNINNGMTLCKECHKIIN